MNIAIISFWHVHAIDYTKQIIEQTDSKIAAIWDEDEERGSAYADQFAVPFYHDYDQLLADSTIEAVVITSATSAHKELILKAIYAGKKVFSEKVLALTVEDCLEIEKALTDKGAEISLSLIQKCKSSFQFAKQMIDSGALGQITYARVRNVHNGSIADWLPPHFYNKEQCGGGAMIDLGAHPMYLLNWLLGQPRTIQSTFTDITGRGVEDNAVSVIEFDKGIIGVSETGFVSVYTPLSLEVSGTTGTLLIRGDSIMYANEETGGNWVTAEHLPDTLPAPLVLWANGDNRAGDSFGIEAAIVLTRMMEAAYKSHLSGRRETV